MAGTYQPKVLSSYLTTRPPPSASLLVLATKGHKQCVCCTVTEPFLLYIAVWPGFHLKHRTLSTKLIALHQVIYKKCNLFSVFPCSVKKCSISFLFPNRSSFLHFCCFGIYLSLGEDLQPRHSAGGRWQKIRPTSWYGNFHGNSAKKNSPNWFFLNFCPPTEGCHQPQLPALSKRKLAASSSLLSHAR